MIDNIAILCVYGILAMSAVLGTLIVGEYLQGVHERRKVRRKLQNRFLRMSGYKGD